VREKRRKKESKRERKRKREKIGVGQILNLSISNFILRRK